MLWLPPADWISNSDLVLEMELLSENDIEGIEAGEDYGEEELDTVVIMLDICQIYKVHVKLSTPIQLISDALFLMKLEKILTISPINSLKFRKEKSNLYLET